MVDSEFDSTYPKDNPYNASQIAIGDSDSSNSALEVRGMGEHENTQALTVWRDIGYPVIIFTSDIHFGGGDTLHFDLLDFLHSILVKYETDPLFKKIFKAIVFLGDVFDMLMDGVLDIVLSFSKIYDLLQKLYDNGIHLLFTLGNHEISVTGNVDRKFERRMKKLIETIKHSFTENFYNFTWLHPDNFCQYISLHAYPGEPICLDLLYKVDQFKNNHFIRRINIDIPLDSKSRIKCFGAHGFQFPKVQSQVIGTLTWNILLSSPDNLKIVVNKIWNESDINSMVKTPNLIDKKEIKQRFEAWKLKLFSDAKSEENKHTFPEKFKAWKEDVFGSSKNPFKQLYDKIKEDTAKNDTFLGIVSNLMAETQKSFADLVNDDKKIILYLKENNCDSATHVIYGHTHKVQESELDGIKIYNTGAWQHVPAGTFICFYYTGTFKVY
jgi:UDP-2,3-diacylglucosamine pyrophosphatase LpxH